MLILRGIIAHVILRLRACLHRRVFVHVQITAQHTDNNTTWRFGFSARAKFSYGKYLHMVTTLYKIKVVQGIVERKFWERNYSKYTVITLFSSWKYFQMALVIRKLVTRILFRYEELAPLNFINL